MDFYLASTSQRRQELLAQLDVPFQLLSSTIDESKRDNETAVSYVERMAKEKAEYAIASLEKQDNALVLAADTVVVLGDKVLGKPQDEQHAGAMLRQLSGRSHVVMTAFALKTLDKIRIQRVNTTVFIRDIRESEIAWYWSTGEQQDKAGGYGIQGAGGVFVSSITGSYSSVVGLPLVELLASMREFGIDFTSAT